MDQTVKTIRMECKDPGTLPVSKVRENILHLLKDSNTSIILRRN